ncbi:Zinc finger CCCH domain-containing protein 13, partial [Ophiophagus hannah]
GERKGEKRREGEKGREGERKRGGREKGKEREREGGREREREKGKEREGGREKRRKGEKEREREKGREEERKGEGGRKRKGEKERGRERKKEMLEFGCRGPDWKTKVPGAFFARRRKLSFADLPAPPLETSWAHSLPGEEGQGRGCVVVQFSNLFTQKNLLCPARYTQPAGKKRACLIFFETEMFIEACRAFLLLFEEEEGEEEEDEEEEEEEEEGAGRRRRRGLRALAWQPTEGFRPLGGDKWKSCRNSDKWIVAWSFKKGLDNPLSQNEDLPRSLPTLSFCSYCFLVCTKPHGVPVAPPLSREVQGILVLTATAEANLSVAKRDLARLLSKSDLPHRRRLSEGRKRGVA